MQYQLQENFRISSADADFQRKLKVSSLINMFIQIAWKHAEEMGYGVDSMNNSGLAWMLSRMHIKIIQLPSWSDSIQITTWPKGIRKLFYLRDVTVNDLKGNPMIIATSEWLMIDINARRPKIKDPENPAFWVNRDKHAIESVVPALDNSDFDPVMVHHRVRYSDIDLNEHLTATRYIDLMFDSFDLEFIKNSRCKEVILNFMHEITFDENIHIQKHFLENENACRFRYTSDDGKSIFFRGQLIY
jgi:medium-chain acyl-[acyl-carrier-protein] hydrolase